MEHLLYVERAAENLQFFLWFKGYSERFEARPANEKLLSPNWTFDMQKAASTKWLAESKMRKLPHPVSAADLFHPKTSGEFGATVTRRGNPFITPPASSHDGSHDLHRVKQSQAPSIAPTIERGTDAVAPWESTSGLEPIAADMSVDRSMTQEQNKAENNAFDSAGPAQSCKYTIS